MPTLDANLFPEHKPTSVVVRDPQGRQQTAPTTFQDCATAFLECLEEQGAPRELFLVCKQTPSYLSPRVGEFNKALKWVEGKLIPEPQPVGFTPRLRNMVLGNQPKKPILPEISTFPDVADVVDALYAHQHGWSGKNESEEKQIKRELYNKVISKLLNAVYDPKTGRRRDNQKEKAPSEWHEALTRYLSDTTYGLNSNNCQLWKLDGKYIDWLTAIYWVKYDPTTWPPETLTLKKTIGVWIIKQQGKSIIISMLKEETLDSYWFFYHPGDHQADLDIALAAAPILERLPVKALTTCDLNNPEHFLFSKPF